MSTDNAKELKNEKEALKKFAKTNVLGVVYDGDEQYIGDFCLQFKYCNPQELLKNLNEFRNNAKGKNPENITVKDLDNLKKSGEKIISKFIVGWDNFDKDAAVNAFNITTNDEVEFISNMFAGGKETIEYNEENLAKLAQNCSLNFGGWVLKTVSTVIPELRKQAVLAQLKN